MIAYCSWCHGQGIRRTQYYCMRKQMGEREGAAAQDRFLAALCDVFPPPGVHIQPATAAAVLLYTSI